VPPVSVRFLTVVAALATVAVAAQQQPAPPDPAAQQQQQQPQPPPRFRIEANYVRVDVYPTKDGVPVQDLKVEDFEVLENGARQQVQAFEHIVVSPAGPQSLRVDPGSVRAGEQAAANPRNRVFVFFIDRAHVSFEGAGAIREPLIRLIDRVLGPDDVVAVMTTDMSAGDITFGRKTQVIAEMLRQDWSYGRRMTLVAENEHERQYESCFPNFDQKQLVEQLIRRRRERVSLDALYDLVRYLGSVREERKAIIAVTEGWPLYRPDDSMLKLRNSEGLPGKPPVGVDEFGKLRVNPPRRDGAGAIDITVCERERMYLANIDDEDYLRRLTEDANRNNASFYPVDPRGLEVFETDIGPKAPPSLTVDREMLRRRLDGLRTLADATDGMAVIDTNNLEKGMHRIADDLTSYYLLGYYTTNSKLDGQYRKITVKVKRPGVDVRARRGYRAATAEEVNAGRPAAAAAPVSEAARTANAALSRLARVPTGQGLAVNVTPVLDGSGSRITAVWVAGEVLGPRDEFGSGGALNIVRQGGGTEGGVIGTLKPGERSFLTKLTVDTPPANGARSVDIDVKVTPAGQATPLTQVVKVSIDPNALQPMPFKRGLSTGNRLLPAASFEFSRTDRLQLQVPLTSGAKPGTGRFLDRTAQPLQIPVQVGEKTDEDGQRWLVADAVLAPLAPGEYVIELSFTNGGGERKVLTAIRVTR
jgi:VWFA-related protein